MKSARMAALVLGILNIWYQLLYWLPIQWGRSDIARDMALYYKAAADASAGRPMFHHASAHYGPDQFPGWYVNPPHLAATLTVFGPHYLLFSHCWYLLMLASFWTFAFCLARLSGRATIDSTVIWGLILGLTPYCYYVLSMGNVDVILWAMFAAAIAFEKTRAVLFGLMSLVKPYAVWPLGVHISRNGGRFAVLALAVMLLWTGVTIAVVGLRQIQLWIEWVLPATGQGTFFWWNCSLSFLILRVLRLLGLWHYGAGPLPPGPRLFLAVAAFVGPALVTWRARKFPEREFCMVAFFAAMVFSPLCWMNYMIMGYVPLAAKIATVRRKSSRAEVVGLPEPTPARPLRPLPLD